MAEDYYKTLGVAREASQAEIQKAYRNLAKKYHPDMNPGDKSATKKFQEIQTAFDVLSNAEKREMYDRYGSSFETAGAGGVPPGYQWQWSGAPGAGGAAGAEGLSPEEMFQFLGERFGGEAPSGMGDFFSRFTRGAGNRTKAGRGQRGRGADVAADLEIPFTVAIAGGQTEIGVHRADGKTETIVVKIPPGIGEGKTIRLRGQGEPASTRKAAPGDIIITIHVAPHAYFQRQGNNLYIRLPVTLAEAALGAKIDVPTPKGTVALRVPPGTSSGTKLRVKGHGVAARNTAPGDLLAEVQIVLPKDLSDADRQAISEIDKRHPLDPRLHLRW
jgi:DnaJ-class molecular chaperone